MNIVVTTVGNFAVLKDDAEKYQDEPYWIGYFTPSLTHQNGEPLYLYEDGFFETFEEASEIMNKLFIEEQNGKAT